MNAKVSPKKHKKQVVNLLYNEDEIEQVRHYLDLWNDKKKPRFYEIYIGDYPVVTKTDDLDDFDMYKPLLRPSSAALRIKIFPDNVNNNNLEYFFHIPMPTREQPLNGIPGNIDPFELASQQMAQKQKEEEAEMYRELYEEVKSRMEQMASNPPEPEPEKKSVPAWDMALGIFKSVLKHNPNFLEEIKIPGAKTLAGVVIDLLNDEPESSAAERPKSKVTYERIDDTDSPVPPEEPQEEKPASTAWESAKPETVTNPVPPANKIPTKETPAEKQEADQRAEEVEIRRDLRVMAELKSAFSSKEDKDKAVLVVKMMKDYPDLVMALLDELINIKVQAQGKPPEKVPVQKELETTPLPQNHAPPTPFIYGKTDDIDDFLFIQELNL